MFFFVSLDFNIYIQFFFYRLSKKKLLQYGYMGIYPNIFGYMDIGYMDIEIYGYILIHIDIQLQESMDIQKYLGYGYMMLDEPAETHDGYMVHLRRSVSLPMFGGYS